MSIFRINIYLTLKNFLFSFFISKTNKIKKIEKFLRSRSKKKYVLLTSQLRVGFILVLKFLMTKSPKKNEVLISNYNLAEMVNICKNLNLKIIYPKLNDNLFLDANDVRKKISKRTLAVIATNIFNSYEDSMRLRNICKNKSTVLIEDNAIYFGNFKKNNNKKIFAGSFGDYSLNSFNIMKNISAMYGGTVETDDKIFIEFAKKKLKKFKKFPKLKFLTQSTIFLILKILSIKIIYKLFFLNIIKWANKKNNKILLSLVYPSLKFKKQLFPNYYFTNMNYISKNMIYLQIKNQNNFNENHLAKKMNNRYYSKKFRETKISEIKLFNNKDLNFQNYNDFPILVSKKKALVDYLFSKGIETKTIQYVDCHKIFYNYKNKQKLVEYENKILCLPNHRKITHSYIDNVVRSIHMFYKNQ